MAAEDEMTMPPELVTAKSEAARAEGRKFDAEARKLLAEADYAESDAHWKRIGLEREVEKRKDELTGDKYHHVYQFCTDVNESSVRACIKQLSEWVRNAGDEKVTVELIINSPGGGVFEGFSLVDYILAAREDGHTINTMAVGMAASMGGVLLQVGGKRTMGAHAFLLIHEASFNAVGSWGEVEDRMKLIEMMQDRILDLFASRSKMTRRQIKSKWHRHNWWMSADEALKHGFIDEVRGAGSVATDEDV